MINEGILTFPQAVKESSAVEGLQKKGRPKDNERGRLPKATRKLKPNNKLNYFFVCNFPLIFAFYLVVFASFFH